MPLTRTACRLGSLIALTGLLLTTGCMFGPRQGDTIPSKTSKIYCAGATRTPHQMIHVELYNFLTGRYDTIKHAYTGSSAVAAHGSSWYTWGTSIVAPDWRYWSSDSNGEYVMVRSQMFDGDNDWTGENLWTFKSWQWDPSSNLIDFYDEHGTYQHHVKVYLAD